MERRKMRTRHTANIYPDGRMNIPSNAIDAHDLSYNDEVRVVFPRLGSDDEIVGFTRYATANMLVSVPASIRRRFALEGQPAIAEVTATGNEWEPFEPGDSRGGNKTDVTRLD